MHTEPLPFRSIRVFVSSTFRDMQAEREELVKQIFPQLRRMCESRGVTWSEVDLRWGVTDEQKAEGAVLPICLAEIDRSRPFFIGLLGQRYGWIPEELPEGLDDQLPWLRDLSGTSVTEMEILHGVLNDPASAGYSYFYTRDPAWVDTRPADERRVLGELESDDEIATLGAHGAATAAAARRERLEELKRRIDDAGLPTWQYPDPQRLGERVLADFSALIDRLYPVATEPDLLVRDAEAHRAFGLAQMLGHETRPVMMQALDNYAAGNQPPFVITGDPGSDASAVATEWLMNWATQHPDDIVIEHHVGATADASESPAMARRLVAELSSQHGFELAGTLADAADSNVQRAALFAAIARCATATRRSIILIDNADLLTDADGAPDLTWLPPVMPPMVRMVVTASSDRPAAEARRRGWPTTVLPPLDETERRAMIRSFLGRYAKGLDEVHVARLVGVATTGNPLFLRTVLDELRQHGDHFTIGEVIDHYLAAESLDGLLGLVLARYERDFERDRPGLVGDAMRSLWASRRGLSNPELLDILGSTDQALPHAIWSPLMLAAEAGLVTRGGQLVFSTEPHRQAVERRYAATPELRRSAHAAIAQMFETYEISPRVIDELPWQQLDCGDTDGLVRTLADPAFLAPAYRRTHRDIRQLWARAEEAGQRVIDAYAAVLGDPAGHADVAWEVARLVTDAGYPVEALQLHRYLVDSYRAGTDDDSVRRLPAALVNLGSAYYTQGDLFRAEPPLQEAISLSRSRNDLAVLTAALGNLGLARRDRGDTATAIALFAEEEAICRRTGDIAGLQASLGNRATVLIQRGDLAGALALANEQEQLCRSIGDVAGVARALAGQGAIQSESGNPAEALISFSALRASMNELGDLRGAAEAGINEFTTLRQLGRYDEAETLALQTEALLRRLSDEPLLARVLDGRARAATDQGRWADAERLANEALLTARLAGVPALEILALGIIGTARREQGDLGTARAVHLEEERLAIAANQPASIAMARSNLASVEIAGNNLPAALAWYAQAEPVLRQLNSHPVLVPLYNNRWQVHQMMGNTAAAIDDLIAGGRSAAAVGLLAQSLQMLSQAAELMYGSGRQNETEPVWADIAEVARGLGDDASLQRSIGERALLVIGRGDVANATSLLDEQELICRRTGDQAGLAACVGNQAILLRNTGDLAGALRCVDEQIHIAETTGNGQTYLFATANRGEILGALGRVAEGMTALDAARTMAANHGLTPMVQELDRMIAGLRAGQQ
ncbi:MAG: DUF4062 domain-containing protein [Ilumatobacteraceae bacterium]